MRARAKRTCSVMALRIPAWVSTCAKAVISPIQEGIVGLDPSAIWIVTEGEFMLSDLLAFGGRKPGFPAASTGQVTLALAPFPARPIQGTNGDLPASVGELGYAASEVCIEGTHRLPNAVLRADLFAQSSCIRAHALIRHRSGDRRTQTLSRQTCVPNGLRTGPQRMDTLSPESLVSQKRDHDGWFPGAQAGCDRASTSVNHRCCHAGEEPGM